MFLFTSIPVTARPTYFHQLRAAMFNGMKFGITSLFLIIATQSLDASAHQLAIMASANGLGMIGSLLIGRLIKTRWLILGIVIPNALSNFCLLGVAFATSIQPYMILVGLSVFFETLAVPSFSGMVSTNYPATHRGTIIGFIRSRSMLVAILVNYVVADVLDAAPNAYRYLIPAGALFGLLALFRIARIRVRDRSRVREVEDEPQSTCTVSDVLRNRRYMIYQIGFFSVGSGNLILMPLLPKFLKDGGMDYVLSTAAIAVIPGLLTVTGISSSSRWASAS